MEAFPLDRNQVCQATLDYVRDRDGNGRGHQESPFDSYLVHNQNRLCEISYSDPHETSNLYSQALQGGA